MTTISIGLTFPGTCEKAFNLYKSVFGGEFIEFIRYGDNPYTAENTPKEHHVKIAYAAMKIGGVLFEGDDTIESAANKVATGNNVGITIAADTKKEADKMFKALSQGAKTQSPMTDYPWGYLGGCVDNFGVKWTLWYKPPQPDK
jgi:PhnB protein